MILQYKTLGILLRNIETYTVISIWGKYNHANLVLLIYLINFFSRVVDRVSDLTAFSGQLKSILNTADHSIELYVSFSNNHGYTVDEMVRILANIML